MTTGAGGGFPLLMGATAFRGKKTVKGHLLIFVGGTSTFTRAAESLLAPEGVDREEQGGSLNLSKGRKLLVSGIRPSSMDRD